jgi:hypothetical protein
MQIVLTPEDIKRLQPATRRALFQELGLESAASGAPGRRKPGPKPKAKAAAADPLEALVSSVNDRSRAALKVLVDAGGSLDWDSISSKVPKLEPGRFLASVHRRYRTLTRDAEAVLINAREDGEAMQLKLVRGLAGKLKPLL